jgi:hypothetical protein
MDMCYERRMTHVDSKSECRSGSLTERKWKVHVTEEAGETMWISQWNTEDLVARDMGIWKSARTSIVNRYIYIYITLYTQRHYRHIDSTPASRSGAPGFKSRPEDLIFWRIYQWNSTVPPIEYGIVTQIRPRPLPSTFLPIHYSLITLLSDAILSQLLTS